MKNAVMETVEIAAEVISCTILSCVIIAVIFCLAFSDIFVLP